jgi:DNA-directed RNA polymerase subunit beta
MGELALGPQRAGGLHAWRGYNFEDAILVSEKLVKDDYYTSIHIRSSRSNRATPSWGPEEITRDIPNISESFLRISLRAA